MLAGLFSTRDQKLTTIDSRNDGMRSFFTLTPPSDANQNKKAKLTKDFSFGSSAIFNLLIRPAAFRPLLTEG
jgi:hypothetical protein